MCHLLGDQEVERTEPTLGRYFSRSWRFLNTQASMSQRWLTNHTNVVIRIWYNICLRQVSDRDSLICRRKVLKRMSVDLEQGGRSVCLFVNSSMLLFVGDTYSGLDASYWNQAAKIDVLRFRLHGSNYSILRFRNRHCIWAGARIFHPRSLRNGPPALDPMLSYHCYILDLTLPGQQRNQLK